MPKSMKALCQELRVSNDPSEANESALTILEQWCFDHVSQDIRYRGTIEDKYTCYIDLATHFLEYFLSNVHEPLDEAVGALQNMNPIQYAAKHGYDRYLSEQKDLPHDIFNQANSHGLSPLHLAASSGKQHSLHALLDQGANPNQTNRQGELPLQTALLIPILHDDSCISNAEAIFRTLMPLTKNPLTHKDTSGNTCIHRMAGAVIGSTAFVTLLDECITQDNRAAFSQNNQGHYPIHTAILNNKKESAEALLSIERVPTLMDNNGQTPLHYAARYGSKDLVELCVAYSANLTVRDRNHLTPLLLAAQAKRIPAMQTLLDHGVDPTETDDDDLSILDYAEADADEVLIAWILTHTTLRRQSPRSDAPSMGLGLIDD